ncbi:MAG: hypothetical protein ABII01_07710 [Candidatus Woesearchaeota archaeon]
MINNTNFLVAKTIDEDPILRIGFERNLISASKLAKHIVEMNSEKSINLESVRTCIRRLKKDIVKQNVLSNAQEIISKSYLHVRNNMVKVEFKKDESTLHLINKSFKINELYNNDLFRLIKGHSVLHAVFEESNYERILDLFSGKIEEIDKNLCEFIILMPKDSKKTPGVLITLTNELSMNNINFIEAYSCGEEINLIIDDKDSQKGYNILSNLFRRCKLKSENSQESE